MDQMSIDRRMLLGGIGAMSLSGTAFAAPKDWPATQAFLDSFVGGKRLACCVVGIKRDRRPVEYLSQGTLALDTDLRAGPDSLFRVYSMTKPITGVAFMTLVEKGLLSVDQPISDILPEFRNAKVLVGTDLAGGRAPASPILMRHLITHTSGLSYSIQGRTPLALAYTANGLTAGLRGIAPGLIQPTDKFPPARDLETFGRRLATLPIDFDPGTKWQYSVGLDLMGLVIQRTAGMPFDVYLQETIFTPLKMTDTDWYVRKSKKERLTSVYAARGTTLTATDDRKTSAYLMDRDMTAGGAGLISTARDYMRFQAMLMGEGSFEGAKIMKPETARVARSNLMAPGVLTNGTMTSGAGNGFGAAVQVLSAASPYGEAAGTYGWDGAAGTTMWVDPVNKLAVCGMVQIQGATIHNPLREAVYKDLKAKGLVKA